MSFHTKYCFLSKYFLTLKKKKEILCWWSIYFLTFIVIYWLLLFSHRFSIKNRVYPAILPVDNKKVLGRVCIWSCFLCFLFLKMIKCQGLYGFSLEFDNAGNDFPWFLLFGGIYTLRRISILFGLKFVCCWSNWGFFDHEAKIIFRLTIWGCWLHMFTGGLK